MNLKRKIRLIIDFFSGAQSFIFYLAQFVIFDTFKCYIKKTEQKKKLLVLANGPSLKQSLEEIIKKNEYKSNDVITVNFMLNDDSFFIMKPKYHVISDYHLFYDSADNKTRVDDFFEKVNTQVDWSLTLFITYSLWKNKKWKTKFTNSNLTLLPFHCIAAPESIGASYILSQMGLLGANYGSVLHHSIYIPILLGYKELFIYGADHTFFDGLCVDDNNRVCRKVTHFYDNSTEVKPIFNSYTGEKRPYKMSYFVSEYEKVFLGHDILRYIADKKGVEIYNMTPVSLIDSYKRRK